MSKHISIVFGIISGYSFNRDNLTLSMNISVRIGGFWHDGGYLTMPN